MTQDAGMEGTPNAHDVSRVPAQPDARDLPLTRADVVALLFALGAGLIRAATATSDVDVAGSLCVYLGDGLTNAARTLSHEWGTE